MEQLDSERFEFTNTEIENQPRVSVSGLWIFKFVQSISLIYNSIILKVFVDSHLGPWTLLFGKTANSKYFHNQNSRESTQHAPSDCSHVASLR